MKASTGEAAAVQKTTEDASADAEALAEKEKAPPEEPPKLEHLPSGMMMRYLSWRD